MSGKPTLAVTVVSSNEQLLVPCLETLFRYPPQNCEMKVYATWNGPGRGLARMPDYLATQFPQVEFTESFTSGFPFNQNRMLERIEADYYLVANDDLLFLPGTVEKSIAFLEQPENACIGNLGIKLLNPDLTLQPSTYSFAGLFRTIFAISGLRDLIPLHSSLFKLGNALGLGQGKSRYWQHDRTVEVDTFRGSYMLARGVAVREIGLLDDKGGEETEWNIRFHKFGWKVVFYPGAEIVHLGSMTTKTDPASELIFVRIYLNIYYKHMPRWRYRLIRTGFMLIYLCKYVFAVLRGQKWRQDICRRGIAMIQCWPREAS